MSKEQYEAILADLGERNSVVKWLREVEKQDSIEAAMSALKDYIQGGCGIRG